MLRQIETWRGYYYASFGNLTVGTKPRISYIRLNISRPSFWNWHFWPRSRSCRDKSRPPGLEKRHLYFFAGDELSIALSKQVVLIFGHFSAINSPRLATQVLNMFFSSWVILLLVFHFLNWTGFDSIDLDTLYYLKNYNYSFVRFNLTYFNFPKIELVNVQLSNVSQKNRFFFHFYFFISCPATEWITLSLIFSSFPFFFYFFIFFSFFLLICSS